MTYPTAPSSLRLNWENALSFESSVISQNYYGDVDEKGNRNQINQVTRTQVLTSVVTTYAAYIEIDNFLSANIGKPVYFNNILYVYDSFKWTYQNSSTFGLDISFVQVYRP